MRITSYRTAAGSDHEIVTPKGIVDLTRRPIVRPCEPRKPDHEGAIDASRVGTPVNGIVGG